ncbi:hypothetical protein Gpo141_00002904 [Globisporangium polare]
MFAKTSLFALAALLAGEFQAATAIDYVGGWLPSAPKEQCVDICVNSKATPTCLTSQPECLAKKQVPGDFDYLLMEQVFVPQFCRDLLKGVDGTISHQNVLPYPNGVACKPEVVKSELTIHGLWPNYNDGYVGCCNVTAEIGNHPYNAATFAKNQPALLAELKEKWVDATQSNEYDSLCEIYNHEFQKHGLCYAAQGNDFEAAAVTYFKATLKAAAMVESATKQIDAWAAQAVPFINSTDQIQALYPKKVQVFCSAVDGSNQLSIVRTCFEKPAVIGADGPAKMVDCAKPSATSTFALCDSSKPISLYGYVAPGAAVTPAPTTAAPATPAPTTVAPATPAPTTVTPATPAPTTVTPATPASTPAPTTKAPVTTTTPEPVMPKPSC